MELLTDYVQLCRQLGGMTDWAQGAGGNISIKSGDALIVKESGVRIGDTTESQGYVIMSLEKLQTCIERNSEDCSSAVIHGTGKPSIEAFFHSVPSKYVVHLHPSHSLDLLCQSNSSYIPYVKPGLTLAKLFFEAYNPDKKLYILQNHGVIITTNTVDEVFEVMNSMRGWTDIHLSLKLFDIFKTSNNGISTLPIIKSFSYVPRFFINPLTPDIVLFAKQPLFASVDTLQHDLATYLDRFNTMPNIVCDGRTTYIIANNIGKCYDIFEILQSVKEFDTKPHTTLLSPEQRGEITNWDKELLRQSR